MFTVRALWLKEKTKQPSSAALPRFQVIYSSKPQGMTWEVKGKFSQEITLRKTKQKTAFHGSWSLWDQGLESDF